MLAVIYLIGLTIIIYRLSYYLEKKDLFKRKIPVVEIMLIALFFACYQKHIGSTESAILLAVILSMQYVAQKMDKEYMEVYDIYHYICYLALLVCFFDKLFIEKKTLKLDGMALLCYLLPLIFTLFTITTRGFSDTLAMSIYALYGMYMGIEKQTTYEIITIISFYAGYILQFLVQIRACKKEGKTYNEGKREKRPFLPSLYAGFLLGLVFM